MNQSRSLASILILVLPIIVLGGLVWSAYHIAQSNIAGEGFSIQWISIQSLAKSGSNPYSDPVTLQIQSSVTAENSFVKDNYPRYTSPLYSGVLIFPFILVGDKTLAHALWMTTQLILIFAMLMLGFKLTSWKPSWITFLLFSFFTVFSYHVIAAWSDGGLAIWSGFFLILALVAINANRNEMAGILLALTTVQPQMMILPMVFILVWSISKKRTLLVLWFFISLIILTVIGLFLAPGWVMQYIRLIVHFSENFPPGTPGLFFSYSSPGLGKQLGWLISGIAILGLMVEWLLALKRDFRWFLWTICLTMVLSQWIGIPTIPAQFIELLVPLMLIAALLTERWPRGGQWGTVSMALVLFVWEWGLFYLDVVHPQPSVMLNLIFPLPTVLLIGLFWVRWRAVKPRRLLIEELRLSENY